LLYASGCGALVFSDNFPAISGDFVSIGRLKKALLDRRKQFLFVFYHNCTVVGQEGVNGLRKVEGVRAEYGALAEGRRLHHIRAAHRDKGPTDKDYCRKRVEFSQISHRIAKNYIN
jgi:hypothetical protein